MKITKKHNDGLAHFSDLVSGDVFLSGNCYYLKINEVDLEDGGFINAVRIDTGEVWGFMRDERVKQVEPELIVEV